MTDTRSVPRSEEDPNELLAEFDELLADGSTDEALSVASTEGGSGTANVDENAPAEDLEDLEALFDTFYEEAAPEPAGEGARAEKDFDGKPVPAESPGLPMEAATEDEPPRDALPAAAAGAPLAGTPVSGDAGVKDDFILSADSERADPAKTAPAGAPLAGMPASGDAGVEVESKQPLGAGKADPAETASAQPESQPAAAEEPAEAVTADADSVVAAAEAVKEPEGTPAQSADAPGQNDDPGTGEADSSRNQKQTGAEKDDPEAAEGVFPFVPAGTSMDDPPRRTHPEPTPAAQGGSGTEGIRKLAFVAGGVMALIAAGAGLLAWEAYSDVAALNERLAGRPVSASESPSAAVEAMERRLDELSRRLEALAASEPQGSELADLRAELQAAAGRVAGLDARLEALRARVTTPDEGAAEPANAGSAGTGKWVVNLASLADQESAREELARIRGLGLDAEIAAAPADGRTWYRIRVSGFETLASAKRYARSEAAGAGFGEAWVGRQ